MDQKELKIYNTLSEKKELLKRPRLRKLQMFICGPTVYDHIHIGNFRTYIVFDIFARYLRAHDYKLTYLQNITDIDDKIIDRAKKEKLSWKELAQKYEKTFLESQKALNIQSVDQHARASDHLKEIVQQVRRLVRKGYAYEIKGDPSRQGKAEAGGWYFDIRKFPDYGKLAKRTVEQAEDGISRIDQSGQKRNRGDFALWKFSKEGEPAWDTELGVGRPGWHIEDTAITEKYFGPQYDIHGAGLDLKFPHHEAELAQQEAVSGKVPFVKFWLHVGMLRMQGSKMSKSKGNFIKMKDFLKEHSANTFRYMVFSHHYRSPMDFSPALASDAQKNLRSVALLMAKLQRVNSPKGKTIDLKSYSNAFMQAMHDDLNSPKALASIFNLVNRSNKELLDLSAKNAKEIFSFLEEVFNVLGFLPLLRPLPKEVGSLLKERELSRASKQFDQSDTLREKIESLGYILEDTPTGAVAISKNI